MFNMSNGKYFIVKKNLILIYHHNKFFIPLVNYTSLMCDFEDSYYKI